MSPCSMEGILVHSAYVAMKKPISHRQKAQGGGGGMEAILVLFINTPTTHAAVLTSLCQSLFIKMNPCVSTKSCTIFQDILYLNQL